MGRHWAMRRAGTSIPPPAPGAPQASWFGDFAPDLALIYCAGSWDWSGPEPAEGECTVYHDSVAPGNEVGLDDEINLVNGATYIAEGAQYGVDYYYVFTVTGYEGTVTFGPYQRE